MIQITSHYRAPLRELDSALVKAGVQSPSDRSLATAFPGVADDVKPGSDAVVLLLDEGVIKLGHMKWGWQLPHGLATTIGVGRHANVRWPEYCQPELRCIVPATMVAVCSDAAPESAWFEMTGGDVFGFAGVWRREKPSSGSVQPRRFSLMPGFPSDSIGARGLSVFPRIVERQDWSDWLSVPAKKAAREFCRTLPEGLMQAVPCPIAAKGAA